MSTSHTTYPAVMAGYFTDSAAAEAAMAALKLIETGPLAAHFDRVNIFRAQADLPPEAQNTSWLSRFFGKPAPQQAPTAPTRSNIVVMIRGNSPQLISLVEPVLTSHGAYEIKSYGAWNPDAAEERTVARGSEQPETKR
jgi:hypothetical protein